MAQLSQSKISWYSEQIEIDPLNKSFIIERSDAYALDGKYDEAISDCSKLILLSPSREFYIKRSKLLQDKGMYSLALQDLSDARSISKDSIEETAADIYLQSSLCMANIKEASEMAHLVEEGKQKTDVKQYTKTLEELLHIQQMKLQQQSKERSNEIERLKIYYEQQAQSLRNLFMNQLYELKLKVNETVQNYEEKFMNRLQNQALIQSDKAKLTLYFQTFSSQAEKYYIAAKNLRQIEDKSLRFEDFEGIMINKGRNELIKKLYHFFDKYSSQIEKIVSLIQNIPYIGCAFNAIKASMKVKGWVDEANMENQCINIEHSAINTTAFNELSTNIAFFTTFHFQTSILASHPKYKSQWQLLLDRIKTLKREHLGIGKYKQQMSEEMESVKDYATIHASILMVAVACNCIAINKDILKQANHLYAQKQKDIAPLRPIFKVIEQIEASLRKTQIGDNTPKEIEKNQKGYCQIC